MTMAKTLAVLAIVVAVVAVAASIPAHAQMVAARQLVGTWTQRSSDTCTTSQCICCFRQQTSGAQPSVTFSFTTLPDTTTSTGLTQGLCITGGLSCDTSSSNSGSGSSSFVLPFIPSAQFCIPLPSETSTIDFQNPLTAQFDLNGTELEFSIPAPVNNPGGGITATATWRKKNATGCNVNYDFTSTA